MKKTLQTMVMLLAILALTGISPAFANGEKEDGIDELTMYLIGEPHRDTETVLAELNGYMAEDIGATLKVNYLPWGDWQTKYGLLFASGERFDLIYTSNWAYYFREARNGAFLDISDMVKESTPDLYNALPPEAWGETLIDGRSYMVPCNNPEYDGYGFLYRKDLAVKYGVDPEIDSLEKLGAFLTAVKENEPAMLPYNAGSWDIQLIEQMYPGLKSQVMLPLDQDNMNVSISMNDLDGSIVVDAFEDSFMDYLKLMREWQQKGFWSKNVMSNQVGSRDAFENGTSAIALSNSINVNNLYQNTSERHPDWEFGFFDFYQNHPYRVVSSYLCNGMGINRNAAHPEKALKLLEKLHTDDRYYNLTQYGQEGVHYVVQDGKLGFPEGFDPADGWSFTSWGWNQESKVIPSSNDWDYWLEMQADYSTKKASNPIGDFNFNSEGVQSEIAAVTSVMGQYKTPLYWGLVDPEKGMADLRTQLDRAGFPAILEELELQYRAYRAEK
ncbi:MAG: ABC transporter substrate-binding protein [Spirochaetales bacterium]|nr:ABC transporter substrate-binding protein [Spirochaetales bacterium]